MNVAFGGNLTFLILAKIRCRFIGATSLRMRPFHVRNEVDLIIGSPSDVAMIESEAEKTHKAEKDDGRDASDCDFADFFVLGFVSAVLEMRDSDGFIEKRQTAICLTVEQKLSANLDANSVKLKMVVRFFFAFGLVLSRGHNVQHDSSTGFRNGDALRLVGRHVRVLPTDDRADDSVIGIVFRHQRLFMQF